jgi:TonB family protein
MDGLLLANGRVPLTPRHDGSMLGVAAAVHAVLFALILGIGLRPTRVTQAGSAAGSSIGAYISESIGSALQSEPKPVVHRKPALTTKAAAATKKTDEQSAASGGQSGVAGAAQTAGGPVRLGSGNSLNLLKRVEPVYPPIMRSARMTGQVVLDAVIHADGSIGDVKVLQSTNGAFTQSAIDAVKQWRYAPPGFEAVLTVTVNYTLT